jgi:hypothetical protein
VLAELFDGVSEDDAARIVGRNAFRLFGFDASVLEPL